MSVRTTHAAVLSVATMLGVACSSDTTTTMTADAALTAQAAAIGSSAVTSDANLMMPSSAGSQSSVQMSPFDDDNPSAGCSLLLLRWSCPVRISSGLNVSSAITFYDSTGAPQSTFDALLTASMHIDADMSGSVQHGSWQSDVVRHRHFIVSGMIGAEASRTWSGEGSDSLHRTRVSDSSMTREFEVTINTTLSGVVVPVRGGGRHPKAGTVTQVITMFEVSGDHVGQTYTFAATYTFDGTTRVPFRIGERRFHLDLDADAVAEDH